jgi:hypothetical protein
LKRTNNKSWGDNLCMQGCMQGFIAWANQSHTISTTRMLINRNIPSLTSIRNTQSNNLLKTPSPPFKPSSRNNKNKKQCQQTRRSNILVKTHPPKSTQNWANVGLLQNQTPPLHYQHHHTFTNPNPPTRQTFLKTLAQQPPVNWC